MWIRLSPLAARLKRPAGDAMMAWQRTIFPATLGLIPIETAAIFIELIINFAESAAFLAAIQSDDAESRLARE